MFLQPTTIDEALRLKKENEADSAFVSGGTDLIVMMNHGRMPARVLIDLTHVPGLDYVRLDGDVYRVGGCATFAQLGKLSVKALSQASLSVGGPQIRNRGTIGGNIASASPAADGATALLALDAEAELTGLGGTRTVSLREFFLDYRKTALQPGELVSEVSFPANWTTGWQKLGKRGAMNISLVCCAVGVSPRGKFHVAYGSVGPYPLRVFETEAFLTQNAKVSNGAFSLTPEIMEQAAKMASTEVRPISDFRGSKDYRRAMAGVLLRKVLRELPHS